MLLVGFIYFLNPGTVLDFRSSIDASVDTKETFTVYSANVNKDNKNLTRLINEINHKNAEVVLLLEVTPEHAQQLNSIAEDYPYSILKTPVGIDNLGLVLLSKFPILNHKVKELTIFGNVLIEAELMINQNPVFFYGGHFPRPTYRKAYSDRTKQVLDLAQQINSKAVPVIFAGDMNATPYSTIFRRFLKGSGLKDTRKGFGWQPTWPTYFPPLWLPIDHILISSEIHVHRRTTGRYIGSDHYPVLAELSIAN
jgi:endonuclease/exonuclease/phosphatase (EEP) superfamily protein YafD